MSYNNFMDQGPIDLSTAPSSSSNVSNYFLNQQGQQGQGQGQGQQIQGQGNNQISNQFWGKPQSANASLNISNISSFTPINTASSSSTIPTTSRTRASQYDAQYLRSQQFNTQESTEREERMKINLKIKESQIESLENEIQRLQESSKQIENKTKSSGIINQQFIIPQNINEIFIKLTTNYHNLEKELQDTKQRLESLITAISLNPSNSITNNGRYDELEISHKIILKLDLLKKENEELLNQLGFGKSKQVDIELNLLKMENEKLKEKLRSYQK